MSNVPKDLMFTESHEWIRKDNTGSEADIVTVGITDHAQGLLGDLVYIELPEVGQEFSKGDECCVVESVKAASDVYAPVSGTILEVNENLVATPEQVNKEPYDTGWLFKIKLTNQSELDDLFNAQKYESIVTEEA